MGRVKVKALRASLEQYLQSHLPASLGGVKEAVL